MVLKIWSWGLPSHSLLCIHYFSILLNHCILFCKLWWWYLTPDWAEDLMKPFLGVGLVSSVKKQQGCEKFNTEKVMWYFVPEHTLFVHLHEKSGVIMLGFAGKEVFMQRGSQKLWGSQLLLKVKKTWASASASWASDFAQKGKRN